MTAKTRNFVLAIWEFFFFPVFVVAVLLALRYIAKISGYTSEPREIGPFLSTYALGAMLPLLHPEELLLKRYGKVQYQHNQVQSLVLTNYDQADFSTLHLSFVMLFLICVALWLVSILTASAKDLGLRYPLGFGSAAYVLVGVCHMYLRFAPRVP